MTEYESAPPKLFIHCITVFEQMRREATYCELTDRGETRHVPVYEGFLTKLFQKLGLATPMYTLVMRRLQKMGCVRQLSRGGGSAPSRWELIEEPEYGAFEEAENKKPSTRLSVVEDHVGDIEARLAALELKEGTG
jgi:hypothetical protein